MQCDRLQQIPWSVTPEATAGGLALRKVSCKWPILAAFRLDYQSESCTAALGSQWLTACGVAQKELKEIERDKASGVTVEVLGNSLQRLRGYVKGTW